MDMAISDRQRRVPIDGLTKVKSDGRAWYTVGLVQGRCNRLLDLQWTGTVMRFVEALRR